MKDIYFSFSLACRFILVQKFFSGHFNTVRVVPFFLLSRYRPVLTDTLSDVSALNVLVFSSFPSQCCPYSLVPTALHSTSCMWRSTKYEQRSALTDLWTELYLCSTSLHTAQRYSLCSTYHSTDSQLCGLDDLLIMSYIFVIIVK